MTRKLVAASHHDIADVERALPHLREAYRLLRRAPAPRTAERVRKAITSAGGALRHVHHRANMARDNIASAKRIEWYGANQ